MAYYHARVNACRVGVTRTGLANQPFGLTIAGSSRATDVKVDGFTITKTIDGSTPSTCTLTMVGAAPSPGAPLVLTLGGAVDWQGTIMSVQARAQTLVSGVTFWEVQAIDDTWLMDRFARVYGTYVNWSVNALVDHILQTFTDGGFRVGWVPGSLGRIDRIQFTGDTVSAAISRIAKASNNGAGAYWRLKRAHGAGSTNSRRVDIFNTLSIEGNALSLGNSSAIRDVVWANTLAEVRTRTFYVGVSAQTAAVAAAGSSIVSMADTTPFSSSGGMAIVAGDLFTYTGVSVPVGPGVLTGCSGIADDIPQGASVSVVTQSDNSAAQAALASTLGGGLSGIATAWFAQESLSRPEAQARGDADVAFFGLPLPTLRYTTTAKEVKPGKVVSVSISSPFTISDSFRIQSVVTVPYGGVSLTNPSGPGFQHIVTARIAKRADVTDMLVARR